MNHKLYDALDMAWECAMHFGPWSDELNSIEEALERAVNGYDCGQDDIY